MPTAQHSYLKYFYNLAGVKGYEITSDAPISAGDHKLGFRFDYDGEGMGKGKSVGVCVCVCAIENVCLKGRMTGTPIGPLVCVAAAGGSLCPPTKPSPTHLHNHSTIPTPH